MQPFTTFDDVNRLLSRFKPSISMKEAYTLDRMKQLMEALGNPQNSLRVIHIAGTSGKTSTVYYESALLKAAGQKVGSTVSPHIDSVAERVQINLEPLSEAQFCHYFSEFMSLPPINQLEPTYFELLMAFAFWVFAKVNVDYAVVEVGLGGLLDATNVITNPNKVCVITDIGYDHMQVLGDTIEKIAAQKAGIITTGSNVFTVQQSPKVIDIFQALSNQNQAKLNIVKPIEQPFLADIPPFAARNWQLAKAAFEFVAQRDQLPALNDSQIKQSAHTVVPARMEVLQLGDKTVVIDGSHNQQKLQALTIAMQQRFPGQKVALLTSFVDTRADRLAAAVQAIEPIVKSVIITSYGTDQDFHHQSLDPLTIQKAFHQAGASEIAIISDPQAAFRQLLLQPQPVLLVTGSFYLLNHIWPLLNQAQQAAAL